MPALKDHDHTPSLQIGALGALIATQLYVFYAAQSGSSGRTPPANAASADPLWSQCKQLAAQLITDMESWATAELAALDPAPTPPPKPVPPSPFPPPPPPI